MSENGVDRPADPTVCFAVASHHRRKLDRGAIHYVWICFVMLLLACGSTVADDSEASANESDRTTTVGLPKDLSQVVLPGPELVVRPMEDRNDPFVLRIIASYPHGTDRRYDFRYYSLEPGSYNLVDYLQRADAAPLAESMPEIVVTVRSTLPPGQLAPSIRADTTIPRFGGYTVLLVLAGILWLAGLLALIFVGRSKGVAVQPAVQSVASPEDRLRSLIDTARHGEMPPQDRASLERAVIGFWQNHLKLNELTPAELSIRLKDHETAGPMLRRLERWLHAPEGDDAIDLESVLRPIDDRLAARSPQEVY